MLYDISFHEIPKAEYLDTNEKTTVKKPLTTGTLITGTQTTGTLTRISKSSALSNR
jgi:hypothetical protein